MTTGQPLGFAIVGVENGDGHRTVARFRCVECPTSIDLTIKPGQRLNPQGMVDLVKQRGWEAHPTRSNRCYCPRCAGPRRMRRNDTGSELRRIEPRMTATQAVAAIREPTGDQRTAIRRLLELHFDETEGCYRADWSDARVAAETGAPRTTVERLRDAAFGPIRVSPETIALRKDLAEIRSAIESLNSGADALAEQLRSDAAALADRVAAIERRIGTPVAAA